MTEFDDIRPYNDSEVPAVIARLLDDKEFLNLLLTRKAPILTKLPLVKMFARPFIKKSLGKLASEVRTVEDFQSHMSTALVSALQRTTDSYSFSGVEKLDPNKAYLFMSNHRDIALDPAMVNLGLILNRRIENRAHRHWRQPTAQALCLRFNARQPQLYC